VVRRVNSAYEPGALKPSCRMRSAISSSAAHCSVYWVSNITCRALNIGPVTFQWKLWVFRYSVKLSDRKTDSPSAIFRRSAGVIPMSIAGAEDPAAGDAAGVVRAALRALVDLVVLVDFLAMPGLLFDPVPLILSRYGDNTRD